MIETAGQTDFRGLIGQMENRYVKEWKASGKPVAGFFCCHAPEELLWAAGMLPIRMRAPASRDTSHADQYLGPFNCCFVRHTPNQLVGGELGWLDGILITNSCDHIRRLFDICVAKSSLPFCHYIDVPHISSAASRKRLTRQLAALKSKLESAIGASIAEDDLVSAIKLYNRSRRLLQRLSELRCSEPARTSGSELLAMAVAAASMPRDRFNSLLEAHLADLGSAKAKKPAKGGPRLIVIGGMLDDPGYLEVIESLGGRIVGDQLCCCSKTFSTEADESIDPLEAIARRMLEHTPCPRMVNDYRARFEGLRYAVERWKVDGVICQRLKFCDLWAGETEMLRRSFKDELGVPLLVLERDYLTEGGVGQLRTRVQAFLESLS